jgi:hypothetical protein
MLGRRHTISLTLQQELKVLAQANFILDEENLRLFIHRLPFLVYGVVLWRERG